MKKLDFPINRCTIDLTEKCNLRCKYCFTYGVGRRDNDFKQVKKTVDWLFKDEVCQSNELQIDWWGGEPLLRFELMKRVTDYTIEKASRENKKLMIGGTTNATLVTKEVVDWMDAHRTYFMLSIDGPGKMQVKRPTSMNSDSWELIAKNLPYIKEKIPFVRSRSSPTPEIIKDFIEGVKELKEKWGIDTQMFSPAYEEDWNPENLKIAEEQLKLYADYIIDVRKRGSKLDVKHLDDGAAHIEYKKTRAEFPCGAGRFYVGISVDGHIYPCHRFNKYNGKNPYDKYCIGSIEEGITRPELREPFIHFIEYPPPQKCKDCKWYGSICDMSCYAISYDLSGDIKTPPDKYCAWMEIQGNAIVYFHKKLKENNIPIRTENMGGPQPGQAGQMSGSCICNNMCYLEGTQNEIKNVDWNNPFGCHCYNTNYASGLSDQTRALTETEMLKISPRMDIRQSGQVTISQEGKELLNRLNETLTRTEMSQKELSVAISNLAKILEKKL